MRTVLKLFIVLALARSAAALPALEWRFPALPLRTVFRVPAQARTNLVLTVTRTDNMPVSRDAFLACGPDGVPLPIRLAHAGPQEVVLSIEATGFSSQPCAVYYGSRPPGSLPRSPEAGVDQTPLAVGLLPMRGRAIPTSWDRLRYMLRLPRDQIVTPYRLGSFDEISGAAEEMTATKPTPPADKPARRRFTRGVRLVTVRSLLICPRDGAYRFAIDCTDAGFVVVDGEPVAAWPGEHDAKTWQIGAPVSLQAGLHRLEVYNMFDGSRMALRVGWVLPRSRDVVPIRVPDLVGAYEAMETRAERMTRTLQPGFSATPVRAYSFRGDPNVFTMVQYTNLTENWIATGMESRWTFGDGARSTQKNPVHVYAAADVFKTTLEVRDALGFVAGCSDSVDTRQVHPEEYAISFDMTGLPAVTFERDTLAPFLRVDGTAASDIPLDVSWDIRTRAGASTAGQRQVVPLGRQILVPLPPVAVKDADAIGWQVRHREVTLAKETVRFVHPPFNASATRLEGDRLYDAGGTRLVLVPEDAAAAFRQPALTPARRWGRLVCVDDSLAVAGFRGQSGETFDRILARLLTGRAQEVQYAELPGWDAFPQSCGPLRKLVDVPSLLRQKQADVAILSLGLRDILELKDVDAFERQAAALSDLVTVSMRIPVIWVTPPPYPSAPERSRLFAAAIRRVAEARGIPVADLYTAFRCATDSRHAFFEDNPLVLSAQGHRLAGQQIAGALVGE